MAKAKRKKQEEPEVTEETIETNAAVEDEKTAAPAVEDKQPKAAESKKAKDSAPAAMKPVETWGAELNLADWEVAGVKRALGWARGKLVTEDHFKRALAAFRARGMGGGRIRLE